MAREPDNYVKAEAELEAARDTTDARLEDYHLRVALVRAILAVADALAKQRWRR